MNQQSERPCVMALTQTEITILTGKSTVVCLLAVNSMRDRNHYPNPKRGHLHRF